MKIPVYHLNLELQPRKLTFEKAINQNKQSKSMDKF